MKITFIIFLIFLCLNGRSEELKIIVVSDMNGSYGSTQYHRDVHQGIKKIIELKPDIVISTGDMVAGQKAGLNYSAMWEGFHQVVTTPLQEASIPFAVTVGNHDGSAYFAFRNERNVFLNEWKMHLPELNFSSRENYPAYYSFIVKNTLFISIDSTLVGELPMEQILWLENELMRNENLPNKIIFTHVPLFHYSQMNSNESYFDPFLYALLKKYNVNFYLTGHHHAYYPGYHENIHYISQACLGSAPRALIGNTSVSEKAFTVIQLNDGRVKIYALKAPYYDIEIDHQTLPESIPNHNFTIIRKAN